MTLLLLPLLMSCKEGVVGGSIVKSFEGISTYTVLSPTAIELNWIQQDKYREYQVFELGRPDSLEDSKFDTFTVENLTPNTEYVFKVVAIDNNGESFGGENEIRLRTMPHFTGITSVERDVDGNVVLNWDFPFDIYRYHIFVNEGSKPTAATTSNWESSAALATSDKSSYTFTNLSGSTSYYFQVHVEYRKGEFGRPDQDISEATAASFPDPLFSLPEVTIGSVPFATITPIVNGSFLDSNYTSQFFHGIEALSDPLVGVGVVSFLGSSGLSLGKIDNITLKVNYDDGVLNETFTQNNLSTYIKGMDPHLDLPQSLNGVSLGRAALGQSMASGDFNCDGFDDLAIGMPEASIGSLGVSSVRAGAIYVYYSVEESGVYKLYQGVEPKVAPVRPGKDPQIITFSDSNYADRFGFSMSSGGNLNGDKEGNNECEDLVVGAPFARTGPSLQSVTGAAYVFFGNRNGLSASQTISNIQENIGTCNGASVSSSCSAVKIWPDYRKYPTSVFPSGYESTFGVGPGVTGWEHSQIHFGHAVNFIGDFNADGYDDIAVGAPLADWDGEVNLGAPGENRYLQNVGAVFIFFGSPNGVGFDKLFTGDTAADFPFAKIYPPIPHAGMAFGSSISNGADVNGHHRVKGKPGDSNYYGGSDFVVGAPNFYYPNPELGHATSLPSNFGSVPPEAADGWTTTYTTVGAGYYGFSQNDPDQPTGAAFLFFGRDSDNHGKLNSQDTSDDTDLKRASFWDCDSRLDNGLISEHFSCLADQKHYRILFPRNNNSQKFGSAVALLGNESFYDASGTTETENIDANGDGYADIIVAASQGEPEGSSLSSSGVLWQFYGNDQAAFGHNFLSQGLTGGASGQYLIGSSTCDEFRDASSNALNQANCRPTLLQSNSFGNGSQLGLTSESITVGQITSDGLLDVIVGAPYDDSNGNNAGVVLVFSSDINRGISSSFQKIFSTDAGDNTQMGYSVAVGNFDGDTYANPSDPANPFSYYDIAAGGPGDDSFRAGSGSAHLFLTGGFHIPAFKSNSNEQIYDNLASPQLLNYQNTYIVGDVNGDKFDDAVSHSVRYNASGYQLYDAVVYFGSETGGLVTTTQCLAEPSKYLTNAGNTTGCYPSASHDPGTALPGVTLPQLITKYESQSDLWAKFARPAGDVNNDGFDDVIFYDNDTGGKVLLYFGSTSGLLSSTPQWLPVAGNPQIVTANFLPQSSSIGSQATYGHHLTRVDWVQHGDFNKDGFSDIVLLNSNANSPSMDPTGSGWDCGSVAEVNALDTETRQQCEDGVPADHHGRALVIYGSLQGLQTPSLDTTNFSVGQDFDFSNTVAGTYIDIYGTESGVKPCDSGRCKATLIQNPVFENVKFGFELLGHRFGASSAVLDTDNNTFDDLFIGAPNFEDISCYSIPEASNPNLNYGRVYIFRGSAEGLVAAAKTDYYNPSSLAGCPASTGIDDALHRATDVRALQPPQVFNAGITSVDEFQSRQFGYSMSVAGDTNGDGVEDLIVGAYSEDNFTEVNSGSAYMFYGPICNTDNNDDYGRSYAQLAANVNRQPLPTDPSFPGTVIFAGDCPSSAGKLPWQKFHVRGSGANSYFGLSLEGARKDSGDFNGDGFDDIIIGSPYWDDSFNNIDNVGRGIIYFGSSTGLYTEDFPSTNVIANEQGQLRPYSMQPNINQTNSYFFSNSISFGDFNDDNTADIIVPSIWYDGDGVNKGVDLGAFLLFY